MFGNPVRDEPQAGTYRNSWRPEWEPTTANEPAGPIRLQSITAMPHYSGFSFEEHHLADLAPMSTSKASAIAKVPSSFTKLPNPFTTPSNSSSLFPSRGGWDTVKFTGWNKLVSSEGFYDQSRGFAGFHSALISNPFFQGAEISSPQTLAPKGATSL